MIFRVNSLIIKSNICCQLFIIGEFFIWFQLAVGNSVMTKNGYTGGR